jgi:hypothetical protein
MISILKKRQEGQIYALTTLLGNFYAHYPRSGRIQILIAFCPPSTAIFGTRQGVATLFGTQSTYPIAKLDCFSLVEHIRSLKPTFDGDEAH